jgi:signal transduction histidine kinase
MREATNLFDLVSMFISERPQRRVRIRMDVPSPSSCIVAGEPDAWDRALRSLIQEAFLATPVDLAVDVVLRASRDVVELDVIDRGCGILPEDYSSVIEAPELDHLRTVLDSAGGSISVVSSARGSTFKLILPAVAVAERAA